MRVGRSRRGIPHWTTTVLRAVAALTNFGCMQEHVNPKGVDWQCWINCAIHMQFKISELLERNQWLDGVPLCLLCCRRARCDVWCTLSPFRVGWTNDHDKTLRCIVGTFSPSYSTSWKLWTLSSVPSNIGGMKSLQRDMVRLLWKCSPPRPE